jgi:antitoxin (DNA-binding transcriptional repressor) of toxin-antitoxin stability system
MDTIQIPLDEAVPRTEALRFLANRVRAPGTRYVLTIGGRPVAALVGLSDLEELAWLDNIYIEQAELVAAERAG